MALEFSGEECRLEILFVNFYKVQMHIQEKFLIKECVYILVFRENHSRLVALGLRWYTREYGLSAVC